MLEGTAAEWSRCRWTGILDGSCRNMLDQLHKFVIRDDGIHGVEEFFTPDRTFAGTVFQLGEWQLFFYFILAPFFVFVKKIPYFSYLGS